MASGTIKTVAEVSNSPSGQIGGTGYIKFQGVLIQWGTVQANTVGTTNPYRVTFPIEYGGYPTVIAVTGAGDGRGYFSVEDVANDHFEVYRSITAKQWIRWIAIGRL